MEAKRKKARAKKKKQQEKKVAKNVAASVVPQASVHSDLSADVSLPVSHFFAFLNPETPSYDPRTLFKLGAKIVDTKLIGKALPPTWADEILIWMAIKPEYLDADWMFLTTRNVNLGPFFKPNVYLLAATLPQARYLERIDGVLALWKVDILDKLDLRFYDIWPSARETLTTTTVPLSLEFLCHDPLSIQIEFASFYHPLKPQQLKRFQREVFEMISTEASPLKDKDGQLKTEQILLEEIIQDMRQAIEPSQMLNHVQLISSDSTHITVQAPQCVVSRVARIAAKHEAVILVEPLPRDKSFSAATACPSVITSPAAREQLVTVLKEQGNHCFSSANSISDRVKVEKELEKAFECYSLGMDHCTSMDHPMYSILIGNRAAVRLRQHVESHWILRDVCEALCLKPDHVKYLYRRAEALMQAGMFKLALTDLNKCRELNGNIEEISSLEMKIKRSSKGKDMSDDLQKVCTALSKKPLPLNTNTDGEKEKEHTHTELSVDDCEQLSSASNLGFCLNLLCKQHNISLDRDMDLFADWLNELFDELFSHLGIFSPIEHLSFDEIIIQLTFDWPFETVKRFLCALSRNCAEVDTEDAWFHNINHFVRFIESFTSDYPMWKTKELLSDLVSDWDEGTKYFVTVIFSEKWSASLQVEKDPKWCMEPRPVINKPSNVSPTFLMSDADKKRLLAYFMEQETQRATRNKESHLRVAATAANNNSNSKAITSGTAIEATDQKNKTTSVNQQMQKMVEQNGSNGQAADANNKVKQQRQKNIIQNSKQDENKNKGVTESLQEDEDEEEEEADVEDVEAGNETCFTLVDFCSLTWSVPEIALLSGQLGLLYLYASLLVDDRMLQQQSKGSTADPVLREMLLSPLGPRLARSDYWFTDRQFITDNTTVLHELIPLGDPDLTAYLLECGVYPSPLDKHKATPLDYAEVALEMAKKLPEEERELVTEAMSEIVEVLKEFQATTGMEEDLRIRLESNERYLGEDEDVILEHFIHDYGGKRNPKLVKFLKEKEREHAVHQNAAGAVSAALQRKGLHLVDR